MSFSVNTMRTSRTKGPVDESWGTVRPSSVVELDHNQIVDQSLRRILDVTVPRKRPLGCPIERCISVISGRWKAMILWRLFVEPQRYSALERAIAGVSQRALSQALAELATDGVIARDGDSWALTPLGEAMRPALAAMFSWGSLHQSGRADELGWDREQESRRPLHLVE